MMPESSVARVGRSGLRRSAARRGPGVMHIFRPSAGSFLVMRVGRITATRKASAKEGFRPRRAVAG
jgi:hypothetical protein